jgi:hypothetical protein
MSRGFIAVSRGIFDHPIFADEPFTEREAWLWLVEQAVWRDTRARVGRSMVELKRGQCAFAARFMAQKWRWSEARVRRFFKRLTGDAMMVVQPTRNATLITICNYDKYQGERQADDAQTDAQNEVKTTQRRNTKQLNNKNTEGAFGKIFDEGFWPAYPKREGSNPRAPARSTFLTAVRSGHEPDKIVAAVKKYAASLAKSNHIGTRYVAQAVTWLRQARWEEYEDAPPSNVVPIGFYAAADSPELDAWDAHKRAEGKGNYPRDKNGGWYVPARWPPGYEPQAATG